MKYGIGFVRNTANGVTIFNIITNLSRAVSLVGENSFAFKIYASSKFAIVKVSITQNNFDELKICMDFGSFAAATYASILID